jgi:hypothetical protein
MTTKQQPGVPGYTTVELNSLEEKLARLALEKQASKIQAAAQEYAETVSGIPVNHVVEAGSRIEFGAEVPGGPIVMRVYSPPQESKPDGVVPAPAKVRAGKRGKR